MIHFIVVAFFILSATAYNPGGRRSSDGDGSRSGFQRALSLESGKDFISFFSSGEGQKKQQQSKFHFDLRAEGNSPLRIRVRFFSRSEDQKSALNIRLTFGSIVEFKENSSPFNGFDELDTIKKTLPFDSSAWRDVEGPVKNQTQEGTKYTFTIRYPAPWNVSKDLFILRIHFSDAPFEVNKTTLQPNSIKIDVEVHEWEYAEQGDYLALECRVQSAKAARCRGDCEFGSGDGQIRFGWAEKVQLANGGEAKVHVGELKDFKPEADHLQEPGEKAKRWFFSFEQQGPRHLIWDPVLTAGAPSFFLSGIVFLASLIRLLL